MAVDRSWPPTAAPKNPDTGRANTRQLDEQGRALITTTSSTAITVNAAAFDGPDADSVNAHQFLKLLCTGATAITVTLANDVPAGKAVELVAMHATADITAQAGAGATLTKPSSASHSTTEQYEALVYEVDTNSGTNAAWRLVARP